MICLSAAAGCKAWNGGLPVGTAPGIVALRGVEGESTLRLAVASPAQGGGSLMISASLPGTMLAPIEAVLATAEAEKRLLDGQPLLTGIPAGFPTQVRAYARADDGTLLASGELLNFRFHPGLNEAPMPWVPASGPALLGASGGVSVADGVVLKGLTLQLATGMPIGMPGVARVEVFVSGPAYGDGQERARVATLKPAEFRTYTWRPGAASDQYAPDRMRDAEAPTPFTLTALASAPNGREVGQTRLSLAIVGQARVGFDFTKK